MTLPNLIRTLAAVWLVVASTAAQWQHLHQVGNRTVRVANPTAAGSPTLDARVYYPATTWGVSTPRIATPAGGFPVIVFLAGFGNLGQDYHEFCSYAAGSGYVVVANNTQSTDLNRLADDAVAWMSALVRAAKDTKSWFYQAIDVGRIALAGHSSGGGTVVRVLAHEPRYRAGLGFGAWQAPEWQGMRYPQRYAPHVTQPLFLVHGQADQLVPWRDSALEYYTWTNSSLRVVYLMGPDGDHANVVSYLPMVPGWGEVWWESMAASIAFLDHVLRGDQSALERCVGATARARNQTAAVFVGTHRPRVWIDGEAKIGQSFAIHALAHEGDTWLFAAPKSGSMSTPLGTFQLDPATAFVLRRGYVRGGANLSAGRLAPVQIKVPNQASLIGTRMHLQCAGTSELFNKWLSPVMTVTVR